MYHTRVTRVEHTGRVTEAGVPIRPESAGNAVLGLAAVGLAGVLGRLPWSALGRLGGLLGRGFEPISGRKRPRVRRNLVSAGVIDDRRTHRAIWSHIASTFLEILWCSSRGPEAALRHVEVEGIESLRKAARAGRGVLLVSGHIGNWELVSLRAAREAIPIAVVARPMRTRRFERRVVAMRKRGGVHTILRGRPGSSVAAYRWLARGGMLGCIMDRASTGKRMLVPFLGNGTYLPLGPATLACRTGAAVVLGTAKRLEDGTARVRFSRLDTRGLAEPERLAWVIAAAIETAVREAPQQWLWIYRNQPDGPGGASGLVGSSNRIPA